MGKVISAAKLRVGIYARFSSDLQDARSIEDQIGYCRREADRRGWRVVDTYTDRELTGATIHGRDEFARLRADAEAGRFDAVLAEDLDRLSRNAAEVLQFYAQLTFAGVEIITVADGKLDELTVGFKGIMAQEFRKNLAGHVRRGLSGRVREGKIVTGIAYGYATTLQRGVHRIDEAKADIVRRIFSEFLAGASPRTIALDLNAEGIHGPRAELWNGHAINGSKGGGILRNPLYKGLLVWNKRQNARDPSTGKIATKAKSEADHLTVPVEALRIVSDADWDAAQAILATRGGASEKHRRVRPQSLLSGLLRCGTCGGAVVSCGGHNPNDPRLMCWNRKEKHSCDLPTLTRSSLEARILPALQVLVGAKLNEAVEEYAEQLQATGAAARQARRSKQDRLAEVEGGLRNLGDAVANGGGALATILGKIKELETERQTLVDALTDHPEEKVIELRPKVVAEYRKLVAELPAILAADPSGEGAEAVAAIRKVIERVVIYPDNLPDGQRRIELHGLIRQFIEANGRITAGSSGGRSSHHNPRVVIVA